MSPLTPDTYAVNLTQAACDAHARLDGIPGGPLLSVDLADLLAVVRALSAATLLPAGGAAFRLWRVGDVAVVARDEWEAVVTFLVHRGAERDGRDLRLGDLSRLGEDGWLLTRPAPFEPNTNTEREWLARQTEPSAHDPE